MVKNSKLVYVIGSIIIGIVSILGILAGLIFGGVLDSTPKKLIFATASLEKIYNGQAYSTDKWELISGELKDGHQAVVTITGAQTSAGSSANTFDVSIFDQRGADVTHDYEIVKNPGTLTVLERTVELLASSCERTYDGQPLTMHEYEIVVGEFVEGHVVTPTYIGEITDVGECENIASFSVADDDGNDVTANYNLVCNNGLLKVTPIDITIKSGDVRGQYTATPLTSENDNFTIVDGESDVLTEHQVVIECINSQTVVGSTENEFLAKVMCGDEDVSKNYNITTVYGDIIVTPKEITVSTDSDQKIYDGTALTNSGISSEYLEYDEQTEKWIITDTGEEFTYQSLGTIVSVGTGENTITYEILNSDGESSNANYTVTVENGVLTVTQLAITVTSNSDQKEYDGTPLTNNEITSEDLEYDDVNSKWIIKSTGEEFSYTNTGSVVNVGSGENTLVCDIISADGEDASANYVVTVIEGTLTVTQKEISVRSNSAQKVYDGTALTESGITSEDLEYDDVNSKWIIKSTGEEFTYQNVGTIINAGIENNDIIFDVKKADGEISTANYHLNFTAGTLTVNKRNIQIITGDGTLRYNGEEQEYRRYSQPENLVAGHTIDDLSVVFVKHADARIYSNEIDLSIVKVLDENQNDVTDNYTVTASFGSIEILPKKVVIETCGDSKDYDGTPLTCDEYTVSSEYGFVDGHKETLVFTGQQVGVGSSKNTAFVSQIVDAFGNEISETNYEIYFVEGDLEVFGLPGSGSNPDSGENGDNGENGDGEGEGGSGGSGGNTPDPFGQQGEQEPVALYEVTSEYGGALYLKQYAFGDYVLDVNGDYTWGQAPIYDGATVNPQHYTFAGLNKNSNAYSIDIVRLGDSAPFALPYYTDLSLEDMKNDVYITKSALEYTVSYIPFNNGYPYGAKLTGTGLESEEVEYRKFVYQNYLDLPDNTRAVLREVIAKHGLNKDDPYLIGKVADLVSNYVKYDAKTQRYGEDEVEYFFKYAETGKCTHYATAATALFRELNMPARYVVGMYESKLIANVKTTLMTPGHAWVEVYFDGLGWVPVEVTGSDGSGGNGGNGGEQEEDKGITVRPYDIFYDYSVTGAPSVITYDKTDLQGADFNKLIKENGYTYTFTVSGKQEGVGLSYSEITEFVLYDKDGKDITANYKFTFQKGTLQLYLQEITIQTATMPSITYDGLEHTIQASPDNYHIDGSFLEGHYLQDISYKVNAKDAGKYAIVIDKMVIVDQNGNDVTDHYKINRIYGYITVSRREQTIEAGSITINIDQLFEDYGGTLSYPEQTYNNEIGHRIVVKCRGELSGIGTADNEVISVVIYDENGNEVTKNYKIDTQLGELRVTL